MRGPSGWRRRISTSALLHLEVSPAIGQHPRARSGHLDDPRFSVAIRMITPLSREIAARVFDGDVIVCTELLEEMHEECERGWLIIEWLMTEADNADRAKYVGTLFLEDFLVLCGDVLCGETALGRLTGMASTSTLLLEALSVVDWTRIQQPVRAALLPLLGRDK